MRIDPVLSNHAAVDGPLGCLRVLSVVNNAAVNRNVPIPFVSLLFNFERYIPRSLSPDTLYKVYKIHLPQKVYPQKGDC